MVFAAAAAVYADLTHFTWWGVFVYIANNAAYCVGQQHRTWVYAVVVHIMIIAGVVVMSAASCTLIKDAHADMGPTAYFAGNFAIHYYPLLGTVAKRKHPAPTKKTQAPIAVATFLLYTALTRPEGIYGCTIHYNTIAAAAFIAGSAASILIAH